MEEDSRQHALGNSKKAKIFGFALCTLLYALCGVVHAQQTPQVPRIGYLTASSLSAIAARTEAFRQGLRQLGYVEGKNILIEWRSAEGRLDRRTELAADLVRLNVDVIVTAGPTVTRIVKEATSTIPVVMAQDIDPVASGFIATLARPGGNITGLATLSPEISGKQLELLKEIVPKLSRVAVIGNSLVPGNVQALRQTELAAAAFGVQVQFLEIEAQRILRLHSEPEPNSVLTH